MLWKTDANTSSLRNMQRPPLPVPTRIFINELVDQLDATILVFGKPRSTRLMWRFGSKNP